MLTVVVILNVTEKSLLIEEAQLGEQLNHCVHNERRSDFSLMLSMLTDDVLAQSQFKLPKTETASIASSDEQLRRQFDLPAPSPLALDDLTTIDQFDQAKLIENQQLITMSLANKLQTPPLAFRDEKTHVPTDVLTNTTLYCQHQHKTVSENKAPERNNFNANEWLKSVQNMIVKAPLLDAIA